MCIRDRCLILQQLRNLFIGRVLGDAEDKNRSSYLDRWLGMVLAFAVLAVLGARDADLNEAGIPWDLNVECTSQALQ